MSCLATRPYTNRVKEFCTICRGTGAKYKISIQMSSLDKDKAEKEREMILEARRHAK